MGVKVRICIMVSLATCYPPTAGVVIGALAPDIDAFNASEDSYNEYLPCLVDISCTCLVVFSRLSCWLVGVQFLQGR